MYDGLVLDAKRSGRELTAIGRIYIVDFTEVAS
jgi:hypothetical protein